jgi:hypothetical protein
MPTISQLTAVSSVTNTDQVPVYSTDNGDARKASLSVLKTFFNTDPNYINGTWTNAVLITPDIGTPTAGNLINCIGLPLTTGVTGVLGLVNGGSGATTANDALTNFGGTTVGKGVFTAATATDAQNALGATTTGKALFIAATATDAQNALGATTTGKALFIAATAAAGRTAIGAAASGSNSDITELTGLTVPLATVALTFAIAAAL